MKKILQYQQQIIDRDDAFFLTLCKGDKYVGVLGGLALDEKWSTLNDKEKDHLWNSVTRLMTIGAKVINVPLLSDVQRTTVSF